MKNSFALAISVLVAFVILLSLGTWQVKRLAWKSTLIENLDERVTQKPMALQSAIDRFLRKRDVEYLPVTMRGTFLHQSEKHLYSLDKNGRPGWHIYTLMEILGNDCSPCVNRHRFVYINRGFVPYDLKNRDKRPQGQVSAPVELVGLIRIPRDNKTYIEAHNQPLKNQWYWRSLKEMSASNSGLSAEQVTHLVPLFVEERASVQVAGKYFGKYNGKFYKWPRAGVTKIKLANRHLGYVITWYGLALALLGVYGFFLYGLKRRIGDIE